ncbi:MAG: hypothetical protein IKT06_03165 [Aeriscardovia sp.]|nr:hypothetical protein [Aeriscardovia sp.]
MPVTFVKPRDLMVFQSGNEIVLRKGFVHINEVVIDKAGSSKLFLKDFSKLVALRQLEVSESDESYRDFLQLLKLNLIGIKSNSAPLIVTQIDLPEWFKDKYPVLQLGELLTTEEERLIREDKSPQAIKTIQEKTQKALEGHRRVYFIDEFKHFTSLRAINKLLFDLDKEFAVGFLDNENIYLTGIRPKYTGCYMCLEQHILSKFAGRIEDYYDEEMKETDYESLAFLLALIDQDAGNVSKFAMSELTGNVIHMYTPTFEYSFGLNMKSSSCPVCCKINNLKFKEQNIRASVILKSYGEHSD